MTILATRPAPVKTRVLFDSAARRKPRPFAVGLPTDEPRRQPYSAEDAAWWSVNAPQRDAGLVIGEGDGPFAIELHTISAFDHHQKAIEDAYEPTDQDLAEYDAWSASLEFAAGVFECGSRMDAGIQSW